MSEQTADEVVDRPDDFVVITNRQTDTSGFRVFLAPMQTDDGFAWPDLVEGSTAGERRDGMLRLQEQTIQSNRWLPDLLRVAIYEDGDEFGAKTAVHWYGIRVAVEVDRDGHAFVEIDGKRHRVDPESRQAGDARKRWIGEVRERNRQAARTLLQAGRGIVRVPSTLTGLIAGSLPASMPMEQRRRVVRDAATLTAERIVDQLSGRLKTTKTRVSVSWSDLQRQRLVEFEEKKRKSRRPPAPTATLWLERQTEVDSDNLWSGALDLLQYVSTDAVASLFACCIEACERGGFFAATPATVARHRGLDPTRMATNQRQAFREHLRLWTEAEIEVSPIDATPSQREGMAGGVYQRLPLLVYDRTIGIRGAGEVPVYRLHPELWNSMQAGKAWLFDRAALSLDMRRHDLHWRIYCRLTGRWSLSWANPRQDALRKSGGLIRVGLLDLLDGPGFDWRRARQDRGEEALLNRVESALQDLVDWPVRPLLADARLLRGSGRLEDMEVEARPTPTLIEALPVPKRPAKRRKPESRAVKA